MTEPVVIITGASRGIGRATALACVARGARLALGARDGGRLEAAADEVRAAGVVRGWGAYCAGKAALNRLNAVLAAEEPAVTCVAVSPGMTETDMQAEIRRTGPGAMPEDELARFVAAHEDGQMRSVEEVGEAMASVALGATEDLDGAFVTLDDPRVRALTSVSRGPR